MRFVKEIIFRELTDADFFNINKPPGIEDRGGGQSYIDINTSAVSLRNWYDFFSRIRPELKRKGPRWTFPIYSLGVHLSPQLLTIAQRRPASVSIRSQKIRSTRNNRVNAWRPELTGFPDSPSPEKRVSINNLRVYIVKLDNDEYWAGWFHTDKPNKNWYVDNNLRKMFTQPEGYIVFDNDIIFNQSNPEWPFENYEADIVEENIFDEKRGKEETYEKVYFDEDEIIEIESKIKFSLQKIRDRNSKAVRKLKDLYNNECQITGREYTFLKKDGTFYSEAHHLIPLGEGGADSVNNIVILSPLIHRMLHYANVKDIDLSKIKDNKLDIEINEQTYTIEWHPDHGKIVKESL